MARRSKNKSGNWLKRIVIALIAAIAGLLFTKRTVLAPSQSTSEYKLPPVPDVPPAGPEEATPLTEEEQKRLAEQRSEAAGESGNVSGAIDQAREATPNGAVGAGSSDTPPAPISHESAASGAAEAGAARAEGTEEGRKRADTIDQRMYAGSGETESVPPPISYESAARGAAEAEAARAEGTEEGRRRADAIDQRMYIGAPPAGEAPVAPAAEVESVDNPDAEVADAGDERAGDSTASDTSDAGEGGTGTAAAGGRSQPGDTAPDATSEGYDVSDGADHTGQTPADREDPTDVGLDIDVEIEDDDGSAPDLTSEGFDTGSGAGDGVSAGTSTSGALTSGEGYVRLTGDARDCPEEYPIKGNASSRIYHKPGESSYDATIPEICFATSDVAEAMGFRARKR